MRLIVYPPTHTHTPHTHTHTHTHHTQWAWPHHVAADLCSTQGPHRSHHALLQAWPFHCGSAGKLPFIVMVLNVWLIVCWTLAQFWHSNETQECIDCITRLVQYSDTSHVYSPGSKVNLNWCTYIVLWLGITLPYQFPNTMITTALRPPPTHTGLPSCAERVRS